MAEPEVRAADERLRGWLRRAGRSQAASSYGKNYGSTKNQEDDEDDEARAFVSKQEVDEVSGFLLVQAGRWVNGSCLKESGLTVLFRLFLLQMEETMAIRMARRCRRAMCLMVTFVALTLFISMMAAG